MNNSRLYQIIRHNNIFVKSFEIFLEKKLTKIRLGNYKISGSKCHQLDWSLNHHIIYDSKISQENKKAKKKNSYRLVNKTNWAS